MSFYFLHYLIILIFAASLLAALIVGKESVTIYHWLVMTVSGLASILSAAIIVIDRKNKNSDSDQ